MKDFVITCSSTCDMNPYFLRKHNMYYVSFYYYLDGNKYYDNFFKEHSVSEFYERIKTQEVKTSQPDPEQYRDLWNKLIEQGYDILHIELDSGISGAMNSALIAKSIVEEQNKNSRIFIVDSLTATCGYGLLLDKLHEFKNSGNNIEDTYRYAESLKHNINIIFMVKNLDQLIKGGRVSKVAGGIGKILNIIPILHVDVNGKLENIYKTRGFTNAMDEIINIMKKNINPNDKIMLAHSDCLDDIKIFLSKIKNEFPNAIYEDDVITDIGTVIGAHTGKDCLVVSYIGDGRV